MLVLIGLTSRSDFVETENESAVFTTMMDRPNHCAVEHGPRGADFIGVEVPKGFVEWVLDAVLK